MKKGRDHYKKAFGWSWHAWYFTFNLINEKYKKEILNTNGDVLEIGASRYSQISILLNKSKKVYLGVYPYQANNNKEYLMRKFSKKKKIQDY